MKHFKSKKRIDIKKYIYGLIVFCVIYLSKSIVNVKLISNDTLINYLLNSSNLINSKLKENSFINSFLKLIKIRKTDDMLKSVFNAEYEQGEKIVMKANINEEQIKPVENVTQTIENKEPLIYIYNSHQGELYSDNKGVIDAARLLKDKLNNMGIKTIFEESDIQEFMRINNYNHAQSYIASSYYIKEAQKNYPSLKLLIDFHRDSVNKVYSTTNINGKSCARVLFVVGLEHDNYKQNLDLANKLNSMIENKYHGLSRGVLQKEGPGVNGIYNQNLGNNIILLEFGSEENSFEEVSNTIELIIEILKEYVS